MGEKYCQHSLSTVEVSRYSRQMIIEEFGVKGQEKLKASSVLIIGAGGLGCPASLYLAAAGVGTIGIVDYDNVEIDNLHRQVLHSEIALNTAKTQSVQVALNRLNSGVKIDVHNCQLKNENASDLVSKYDIIVDCTDNAATRYLINDAAVINDKPLVSASALRWEGQLTTYNYGKDCPCYRCVFPKPPPPNTVTNCSDGGIMGPVVGLLGSLQALEVIKIIIGVGSSYARQLFLFDGLTGMSRTVQLRTRNAECPVCSTHSINTNLKEDYESFCGAKACDKTVNVNRLSCDDRISAMDYSVQRATDSYSILLDARPAHQFHIAHLPEAINITLPVIMKSSWTEIEDLCEKSLKSVTVICRRGNNSQLAVQALQSKLTDRKDIVIRDVIGGLQAWRDQVDPSFPSY